MLKVIIGEAYKKVIKGKNIQDNKIMYNYAQLNRFHHDRQLQVYMYAFMYVDPETMPPKDHFPATKTFVVEYKKMTTLG